MNRSYEAAQFLPSHPLKEMGPQKGRLMALIAYFKAEPTEYILTSTNGHIFRRGAGQDFRVLL